MKIAEIRDAIDTLNWTRNDLFGATRDEFRRMNVPARLAQRIEACKALVIPARFARDIENCRYAIERAEAMVARWHEEQAPASKVPDSEASRVSQRPRLRLVVDNTNRKAQ